MRTGASRGVSQRQEFQLNFKRRAWERWSSNALLELPTGLLNSCGLGCEEQVFLMHGLAVLGFSCCSAALGEKQNKFHLLSLPHEVSLSPAAPRGAGQWDVEQAG